MRLAALAFALGTVWLNRQAALPPLALLAAVLVAVIGIALIVPRITPTLAARRSAAGPGRAARRVLDPAGARAAGVTALRGLAFALAGAAWACGFAQSRLAERIAPEWEGRRVELTGVVAGLPVMLDRGVRFDFDVESLRPVAPGAGPGRVPARVRLVWSFGPEAERRSALPPLHAGERWRVEATLKRPHGAINAGGFDYEAHLTERGIGATGSVPANGAVRIEPAARGAAYTVERLREAIRDRFEAAASGLPHAGVLVALAIGEQRAIGPREWDAFVRTGTAHLMSISGLHVTLVSGLAGWLLAFGWRRVPVLALALPAQKAGAAAALVAAFAYCLLAGFAVPAQRTLYMVAVVALARLTNHEAGASRTLAWALLVVLLLDPMASVAPGFWLSFGAVAAIFYAAGGGTGAAGPDGWRARLAHALGGWGRMQWAVTLALVPATVALFQQASLVSPLANAVAIPLVSWGVTPLALAAAALPSETLAAPLLGAAHALLAPLVAGLEWLARWEGAVWTRSLPPAWTVAAALVGTAWLIAPRGVPARALGLALFAPLLFHAPAAPAPGELRVEVLDVGQGLAALARTRHHALLFDTGPSWGESADAGSRIVVPALRARGVARLDAAVVSHEDSDHSGGARSVFAALPVDLLWLSDADPAAGRMTAGLAARWRAACAAGRGWDWDGVRFRFVHPDARVLADARVNANDRSCVLRAETSGGAVLLTADIGARVERGLALDRPGMLAARVVFMPHHGSAGASSIEFVRAVSPEIALASAGYRNPFGHPRADVVARWETAGARVLRTDRDGAIELRLRGAELEIATERERSRRWWRSF